MRWRLKEDTTVGRNIYIWDVLETEIDHAEFITMETVNGASNQ